MTHLIDITTTADDAKDAGEVTLKVASREYDVLYDPRCFAMPAKNLGLINDDNYSRQIRGEQVGFYTKPLSFSLMALAKSDLSDADVAQKQAWDVRKEWCPTDEMTIPTRYVAHCQSGLLSAIPEYAKVLKIVALGPHSLAHMATDSNRTIIARKLSVHLWDAAFDLYHNYPSYMKSPPVHTMFEALRDVIATCWPNFTYSFDLDINEDAPSPGLDVDAMNVDESEKVSHAIAITKKADDLNNIMEEFGGKLMGCLGMGIPALPEDGEEEGHGVETFVTLALKVAFRKLERVGVNLFVKKNLNSS